MNENTRKSFYIFLAMVLGVLLFLMVQRAAFIAAFLLGADISSLYAQALGVITTAVAVSFGAWYGVWLGLIWYAAIYEDRTAQSMASFILRRTKTSHGVTTDEVVAMRQGGGEVEAEYMQSSSLPAASTKTIRRRAHAASPKTVRPTRRALAKKAV